MLEILTWRLRGIYFAKYYGGGEGDGCWGKKMEAEGVGEKMKMEKGERKKEKNGLKAT